MASRSPSRGLGSRGLDPLDETVDHAPSDLLGQTLEEDAVNAAFKGYRERFDVVAEPFASRR